MLQVAPCSSCQCCYSLPVTVANCIREAATHSVERQWTILVTKCAVCLGSSLIFLNESCTNEHWMMDTAVSFLFKLTVVDPNFMSIKCIGGNLCCLASYWFYVRLRVVVETRVLLAFTGIFSCWILEFDKRWIVLSFWWTQQNDK